MATRKAYWVYLMGSRSGVLYTGMTSDLVRRVAEHKAGRYPLSFTRQYRVTRLLYFEEHRTAGEALKRERQIKRWRRSKKQALIDAENPARDDLSAGWDLPSVEPLPGPPLRAWSHESD